MACIYVAFGRDDLFKVGQSKDFQRRVVGLRREFKRFGNVLERFVVFDGLSDRDADVAERLLIAKAQGVFSAYSGREWFVGDQPAAQYAASVAFEETFFRKPLPVWPTYSKEEHEKRIAARRLMQERIREAQRIRQAERKKEIEARRALRELRRREIAEREAIRFGLIGTEASPNPKAEA